MPEVPKVFWVVSLQNIILNNNKIEINYFRGFNIEIKYISIIQTMNETINETNQITNEEKKKRGRPKKVKADIENTHKIGRPRKYDINDATLIKQVKTEHNKKYYEKRGYYTSKIKYYMKRYDLINITQDTYSDKPVEELKEILNNIETQINTIRKKNIEDKMNNKQEEIIKKIEERIKVKEQKFKDQQTIKINKKIEFMKQKEEHMIHDMKQKEEHKIHNKKTEIEFKPKQIKMKNI